jgi:hypothetical protein
MRKSIVLQTTKTPNWTFFGWGAESRIDCPQEELTACVNTVSVQCRVTRSGRRPLLALILLFWLLTLKDSLKINY